MLRNKSIKRIIAMMLSAVMIIGILPAKAATTTRIVVAQDGYIAAEGEEVYTDIPAAINALGAAGGTIYVKGAVTTVDGLEDGTLTEHGLVTIKGYTGAETDTLTVTAPKNQIYGDYAYEDITLQGNHFATHGHTVTIGEDVVKGTGATFGYEGGGTQDIFVINGGNWGNQFMFCSWGGNSKSADWTLNGGTIDTLVMGNYTSNKTTVTMGGGSVLTQNGGAITTLYLGSRMQDNSQKQVMNGNFIYTLNDGSVTKMYYGGYNHYGSIQSDQYNNYVLIFNNATMTKEVTLERVNSNVRPSVTNEMLILNNYEVNKVKYASTFSGRVEDIGYVLYVTEGKAEPVFEGSTFKGFKLTADAGKNYAPVANGTVLTPNADGLYDLSPYAPEKAATTITFTGIVTETLDVNTTPTKQGYVFAGWYTDETLTTAIPDDYSEQYAVAKFVVDDVLSVKFQIKEETISGVTGMSLRMVTTVDSLDYSAVGFKVAIDGTELIDQTTKSVYKTIKGYIDGEGISYKPTVFSSESEYFLAMKITGIPTTAYDEPITVTPYWVTLDGTTVEGVARTVTINEIINAQTNNIDNDVTDNWENNGWS